MRRRLVSALALALVAVACSPPAETAPADDGAPAARAVVTAEAREVVLADTVELSAEVAPWAAVTVAAEATGRVVELPVEVGDAVKAGTVLARLDDDAARARLAQAEAQAAEAEAALAQAERDLARGRELAETRDISEGELDRLTLARDTAAARLEAARAGVLLSREDADDTVVRAPIAAVVSERHVEVGSWISPGSPIARLVDRRRLKVRGSAAQRDRARLATGLPAEVKVEALPGERFAGRIRVLGQEADERTGTYLVEVAVEEPAAARRLLPGMQGTIRVEIGSHQALVVPRSALVTSERGEGFFVVRDGVARFVQPDLGVALGRQQEILAGLDAGTAVVVVGQHVLRDGDPVAAEPRPEEPRPEEPRPEEEVP